MSVVRFKPRRTKEIDTALAAIDTALGEVFVRLGERYGSYAVTTVALKYVIQAIALARLKHRPIEDAWVDDLAEQFKNATRATKRPVVLGFATWRWLLALCFVALIGCQQ